MFKAVLKQKLEDYLNKDVSPATQEQFQNEMEELANTYFGRPRKGSNTLSFQTIQIRRYDIVKTIRKYNNYPFTYRYSEEDHKRYKSENENRVPVNLEIEYKTLLEFKSFKNIDKSDKFFFQKTVVYIMLITGRRISELLHGFSEYENYIVFTPAKKYNKPPTSNDVKKGMAIDIAGELKWVFIPLTDTKDVIDHMKLVEDELLNYDKVILIRRINRFLNKYNNMTSHNMRAIYAKLICEDKQGSASYNVSIALNHDDTRHTKSYDNVSIKKPKRTDNVECICGAIVQKKSLSRHMKTRKHLDLII